MRPKQLSNHYAIIVDGKIIDIIPKGDLYKKEKKRLADVTGVYFRLATLLELQEYNLKNMWRYIRTEKASQLNLFNQI